VITRRILAEEDQSADCGDIEKNNHPFHKRWCIAELLNYTNASHIEIKPGPDARGLPDAEQGASTCGHPSFGYL
jgi:hypothetical protein